MGGGLLLRPLNPSTVPLASSSATKVYPSPDQVSALAVEELGSPINTTAWSAVVPIRTLHQLSIQRCTAGLLDTSPPPRELEVDVVDPESPPAEGDAVSASSPQAALTSIEATTRMTLR